MIFGHQLAEGRTLNLGPRFFYGFYWPETGGHSHGVMVGGFVNLDWRLGEAWHLWPELVLLRSVSGDVPVRGQAVQLGVGLSRDLGGGP